VTFLVPGFLAAAVLAALGVVALHVITPRVPRATSFPTARFIPERAAAAPVRRRLLSDPLLLALRVLLVLTLGAGLARPVVTPRRHSVVRVILADVSGAVANPAEVRDSVHALHRPGDVIVAFDSTARTVPTPDSLGSRVGVAAAGESVPAARPGGSVSAALVRAIREGVRARDRADSLDLVVVSPLVASEGDAATGALRALWPGRARLVPVAASEVTAAAMQPELFWSDSARPPLAVAAPRDTIGAVATPSAVPVVARFVRRWRYPPDSLAGAHPVAWWSDGTIAAVERDSARTCMRSIAIPVSGSGDLTLRPAFRAFNAVLRGPCGVLDVSRVQGEHTGAPGRLRAVFRGPEHLVAAAAFPEYHSAPSPLARWLIACAIGLALIELIARRTHVS